MAYMRVAEALVKALEKQDVRYVFGLPGHGNMNILDAIYDSPSIEFKLVRHEQAAAHIADGYARVSGKVGVCCSSVGPGAANMIMGIATAAAASSPILAISGGIIQRWAGRGQLQETSRSETPTDQCYTQILQPIVKKIWSVDSASRVPEIVRKAFSIAQSGRPGPVAIEIPWDLQAQNVDMEIPEPDRYGYSRRIRADAEAVRTAAERLRAARCPLILVGYGAMISGAEEVVRLLAEGLGAPVATSFMAKGVLPEDHPLSVGMVGWLGHPVAHEIIREHADLILAVGFRFSDESTSWWTEGMPFVKENRFIQVDVDAQELAKNYPVEVGLLGDAKATLEDVLMALKTGGERAEKAETLALVRTLKARFVLDLPPMEKTPMDPLRIAEELRKVLPRDSILALDTGAHAHYFAAFYPIYGPRRLLNPGGWTPMGFGPTAIIGAKMAAPETPCVCVTGDGGFFMTGQEVITAVEWEIPVVWIVFNNQTLGAIRGGQQASYGGRVIGTEFGERADFAMWARAMRAGGITVTQHGEIRDAVEHALHGGQPCVVDMIIDRDAQPPPTAGAWFEPERDEVTPFPRGSHRTI